MNAPVTCEARGYTAITVTWFLYRPSPQVQFQIFQQPKFTQIPRNTPFDMADTNSAPVREYKTDLALYEKGRPEYSKESVEFLLNRVGVLPSDNKEPTKLLEIAAGTGKFTRAMVEVLTAKKAKVEIIASDVQREMCDMFRHFVPGIEMLQFPAENMGKIECHMLKLGH